MGVLWEAAVTDPMSNPGRRLYEQARKLQRAKRQMLLRRGVTAYPVREAVVLKFPQLEEAPNGEDQKHQAGRLHE